MRHFWGIQILLTICTGVIFGQDFDVSLYGKYRLKTLSYSRPRITLLGGINSNEYHREHAGMDSVVQTDEKSDHASLTSDLRWEWYKESEIRSTSFDVQGGFAPSYSNRQYKSDRTMDKVFDYRIQVYYGDFWYRHGSDQLYLGVTSNLRLNGESRVQEQKSFDYNEYSERQQREQDYTIGLTVGKGRIRDVMPVHRALLLIDRLTETYPSLSTLSESDVIAIAQALNSKKKYNALHYRPDKYFWRHIESVFDSLGYNLSDMNMYQTLYVQEATSLLHYGRLYGAKFGLNFGIGYGKDYSESIGRTENDSILYKYINWSETAHLVLSPSYVWYRPLSFKSQVYSSVSLRLSPTNQDKQVYNLTSWLGYQYDVTDRIMAATTLQYWYDRINDSPGSIYQNLRLTSSIRYYLIDFAYIQFQYSFEYHANKDINTVYPSADDTHKHSFTINLTFDPASPY